MSILVAYATKNGSTEQVAERIARLLQQHGYAVDLQRARDARRPPAGWSLVILGAPLYNGRWHRDGHRFLKRHRRDLAVLPIAIFGMGPRNDTAEAWGRSRDQLARALSKHSVSAIATTVFGGVDPPGKRETRDLRDWDVIEAWAQDAASHRLAESPPVVG